MFIAIKCAALLLAALPMTGVMYQYVSTQYENYQYPPIGKMIDVGGYKLHINEMGTSNGPSVILDAGMGCNSLDWSLVQPKIAQFARVYSFDRAGYGWSDAAPSARTSENSVGELHTLLQKAEIPGPYIYVGHSFGGVNGRLYASKYPQDIAGIVLVDSGHEDQLTKLPENPYMKFLEQKKLVNAFAYSGIVRLLNYLPAVQKNFEMIPEKIRSLYFSQRLKAKHIKAMCDEAVAFKESLAQLKASKGDLSNMPLIVISAGKMPTQEETGLSTEDLENMNRGWAELQKDLATKSTKSRHIIAQNSGHMIPHHQPEIIVDAVRDMIKEVTSSPA